MKYLMVASLWAAYCALHSYLISTGFTKLMTRLLKNYYAFFRLFYVLFSFVLLVPLINYTGQMDTNVIVTYPGPLNIIRTIITVASLALFAWAFFFNYDSLSFFGIRQIMNLGKKKNSAAGQPLSRKGLLGLMRHPMYLALIIYLWCQVFTLMNIVINTVLTVYVIIGTVLEERKLILEFGDSYEKYKHEVPMLIPFTKT